MPKLFKAYEKIGTLPNHIKELLDKKYGVKGKISNELYNSIIEWQENKDTNINNLIININNISSNKTSNSSSSSKKSKCQGIKPMKSCNDTKGCKYTQGKKRNFCRKSTNKSRNSNIFRIKKVILNSYPFLDDSIKKILKKKNTVIDDYIIEWNKNKELNDKKLENFIKMLEKDPTSISFSSSISRNSLDDFEQDS